MFKVVCFLKFCSIKTMNQPKKYVVKVFISILASPRDTIASNFQKSQVNPNIRIWGFILSNTGNSFYPAWINNISKSISIDIRT